MKPPVRSQCARLTRLEVPALQEDGLPGRSAMDAAFSRGGPHLIEVPSAEMPEPWPYLNLPRIRGH